VFTRRTPIFVYVGADGVLVPRWASHDYVPFDVVTRISRESSRIVIATKSGKRVHLRLSSASEASRLISRLEAARTAAAAARAPRLALLDRDGRDLDRWREEVRRLADGWAAYRNASLNRADILAVLEDPSAPVERRVAATIALSGESDAPTKRRVR